MKRIIAYGLSFCLFLFCCGCTDTPAEFITAPLEPTAVPTATAAPTAAPTATSEPTPEPTPEPMNFSVDPHKIPVDQKAFLEDAQALGDFDVLLDAVFLKEAKITCTDASAAKAAAEVFAASPYGALAALTVEAEQIQLVYAGTGTPAELDAAICAMVQLEVLDSNTTLEMMLKLYRMVSGFEYAETEENNLCNTFLTRSGGPKELASALQFLFAQIDIPAWLAEGKAGDLTHYWVIAELDGILYHFDPVFENGATAGNGLSYFGMSDAAHAEAGCAATHRIGFSRLQEKAENLCNDLRFDDRFSGVTSWSLDENSHTLSLTYNFDPTAQIEIPAME